MTIFLHGPDGYRRTQRLKEALRQFLTKYPGVGIRRFDATLDEEVADKAAEIFGSTSLFSPRSLVVITDALELTPKELKPLVEKTSESETQHLILVADTEKIAKTYARLSEDDVTKEQFPILNGAAWGTFVARELKARDLELSRMAMNNIARAFLGDSWGLVTELDVLAAMPEELRSTRLNDLMKQMPQGAPSWNQLRQLGSGSPADRLVTLAYLETSPDPAAKTFAMAAYFAHPSAGAAGDIAVKTGGWDHEEALVALALY